METSGGLTVASLAGDVAALRRATRPSLAASASWTRHDVDSEVRHWSPRTRSTIRSHVSRRGWKGHCLVCPTSALQFDRWIFFAIDTLMSVPVAQGRVWHRRALCSSNESAYTRMAMVGAAIRSAEGCWRPNPEVRRRSLGIRLQQAGNTRTFLDQARPVRGRSQDHRGHDQARWI
jgi:hypothetical protein